jgi:hypothetical protein
MPYVQKFAPNLDAVAYPGQCLWLVEEAYNTPEPFTSMYPTARDSWDASAFKHETNEMPGVPVPVYFSWTGEIDGVTKDWGDCRIFVPGRGVFGSPLNWDDPQGNAWVADLNEIERLIPGAKYLGWTEDISGFRVVDFVEPESTPPTTELVTPVPEPTPQPEGDKVEDTNQDIRDELDHQQDLTTNLKPADLGTIITNNKIRRTVWAVYGIVGLLIVGIMGGLTAAQIIAPQWFVFATGSYTALSPAFASLAIANISTKKKSK